MPVSERHKRAARLTPTAVEVKEYEILDPNHVPDLRGEFAGVRVAQRGNKQYVTLTAPQAKFYLDQGAIKATS